MHRCLNQIRNMKKSNPESDPQSEEADYSTHINAGLHWSDTVRMQPWRTDYLF
jgi:hypothetical protein